MTGAHLSDFADFHLEATERPEDLYQRLMRFVDWMFLPKAPPPHACSPGTRPSKKLSIVKVVRDT